jgi:glycosyltransferase involved in cell wall biosynthesis
LKIYQINASYKPAYIYGGPTMSVSKLCEELVKARQSLEVLTTTANGESELDVEAGLRTIVDGVPVTYFRRLTKGNSHLSLALILSLWKKLKVVKASGHQNNKILNPPFLVHIHAWWNMVSVGSCLTTHLLSGKVILSPRGTLSSYSFSNRRSLAKNIFHKAIGKHMLNLCHFHVSTEKEKQDILKILSPKSIHVIPNFVELPKIRFDEKQSDSIREGTPFNLLFLSRVEEKKGLDILFSALKKIPINYHLTIAGTGDLGYIGSLQALILELGIHENISWVGYQSSEQKFRLLAEHDLMVLPSHDESFANVVIESLSQGTPVLISNKVGLAEYVMDNDLGWVYDDRPMGLAAELEKAYRLQEKRKLIRMHAPEQVAFDFADKNLLRQYLDMYTQITLCL